MHIKLLSVAVGAALLAGCGTLSGDSPSEGSTGYVVGSDGNSIVVGGEDCLRDTKWGEEAACGGDAAMAEKESEKMEEKMVEKEVAPPPPPPPPPPTPAETTPAPASVEKVAPECDRSSTREPRKE